MKNAQHIKIRQSEYASLKQELLRLRAQAARQEQAGQALRQAEAKAAALEAEKIQLEAEKAVLEQALEEERDRFRRAIKGLMQRRSERYQTASINEEQLSLFAEQFIALAQSLQAQHTALPQRSKSKQPRRAHPGRRPIPEDIPRLNIALEPQEDLTGCVRIGEEVTEELDYLPGHFFVRRFIRTKYARPQAEGMLIAPAPVRVIDKGIPGPMLLAYILVSKYADHLPLYRQLMMFKRSGIDINDVTLNGWVKQVIALLQILYERIRSSMLGSNYLMADESTIRVLDQDKKGATHLGYYWAYRDPVEGSVLFVYEKGRAGKYVRDHLSTFSGYLQTDAYTAYDSMPKANEGVTMVGCWAHVRRKFADALVVEQEQASYFVEQIQRLYAIERFCRTEGLSADARLDARAQAKPILAGIKTRMLDLAPTLTPKNALSIAIHYTLKQWDELLLYTTNGILEIDNNLVENSIRPIALGRKNYLFAGNHEAAQRAAVVYSILATCKARQINPLAYLADVLDKLPARTVNNIDDLLPWNWKPDNSIEQLYKM